MVFTTATHTVYAPLSEEELQFWKIELNHKIPDKSYYTLNLLFSVLDSSISFNAFYY